MDRIYVMQLVRSFECGGISRRDFLRRATAALGSAAVANMLLAACATPPAQEPTSTAIPPTDVPATATTAPTETSTPEATATATEAAQTATAEPSPTTEVTTTEDGLITETVSYTDADGETLMGYLARQSGADPQPAVVVIQEWWGLNEHIEDVTRRFAREGFVTLAPDLYHGEVATEPSEAQKLVMELDMAEAVREIQRAIGFLQQQDYVSDSPVGIVGFCMGGGLVLQTALVEDDLGAAVAFYGSPLSPENAGSVQAPVLGLYGAEDSGIPVDRVEAMDAGFDDAGVPNEVYIYDGAGHAFFNDTRQSYNPDVAEDAWMKTLAWFRRHIG